MKTERLAYRRRNTCKDSYRPAGSSPIETVLFITLGLVGLLAVIIAFLSGSASPKGPQTAGNQAMPMVRYLRSGQFAADARTVRSLIQYLFDLEASKDTALSAVGPAPTNSSLPLTRPSTKPQAYLSKDIRQASV